MSWFKKEQEALPNADIFPHDATDAIVRGCVSSYLHKRIDAERDMWVRMFVQIGFSDDVAIQAVDVKCRDFANAYKSTNTFS